MNSNTKTSYNYPFKRPWMRDNCAAAASGGTTSLRGIIAGQQPKNNRLRLSAFIYSFVCCRWYYRRFRNMHNVSDGIRQNATAAGREGRQKKIHGDRGLREKNHKIARLFRHVQRTQHPGVRIDTEKCRQVVAQHNE